MSWLTDFTSKAENLLTKFDQTAAQTFNESTSSLSDVSSATPVPPVTPQNISPPQPYDNINLNAQPYNNSNVNIPKASYQTAAHLFQQPPPQQQPSKARVPVTAVTNFTQEQQNKSFPRPPSSQPIKKKEDQLFEFLNSNNPPTAVTGHMRNFSGPKTSTPLKTAPSVKNVENTPVVKSAMTRDIGKDDLKNVVNSATKDVVATPDLIDHNKLKAVDAVDAMPVKEQTKAPEKQISHPNVNNDRISNLDLENRLLKNELQSLNEELVSITGRLNEQQKETEKYRLRYENRRSQQNEDYERIRVDYDNQIGDLNEALKAKDSQLAVLRVRIQEADGQLKEKTDQLQGIQSQNEQILKDQSEASGMQGTVMNNLRSKLEEVEQQLQKEKLENQSIKADFENLQSKVQEEQRQYADNVKELQSRQNMGKDKFREMETRLKIAEDSSNNTQKELKDYKDKAARILQAKEKLIASLRQGSDATDLPPSLLSELEEMRQERDMLKEEVQQYRYKNDQLRSEFLDLELLHKTESDDNEDKIEALQSSLQEEVEKRRTAEEDMKRYTQELHFSREELHSVKKSQIAKNQEHETAIKRLQNQINVKHTISNSQEELENRIRTLTDSLIHKQTVVEALSTEKNSLVLQLERLEKQYRDVQNSLSKRTTAKTANQHDVEDPDGGSNVSSMTSIMPDQIKRNVRWRTTVNEIDRFSIRLGVFLRRYPIARLMVIFYMLLLHLWVTFVLLTYTPEMHHDEHPPTGM